MCLLLLLLRRSCCWCCDAVSGVGERSGLHALRVVAAVVGDGVGVRVASVLLVVVIVIITRMRHSGLFKT